MASCQALCETCGESFTMRKNLYAHLRKYHDTDVNLNVNKEIVASCQALCEMCGESFTMRKNLYAHMRKYHDTEVNLIVDKEMCDYCEKMFSSAAALNRHIKKHTSGKVSCTECDVFTCHTRQGLISHLECEHGINMKKEELDFDSMEQFLQWKQKLEGEENVSFVKKGVVKIPVGQPCRLYYSCHRSGTAVKRGSGKRFTAPSVKIGRTCPASMTVTKMLSGKVNVNFCATHTGHVCSVASLKLTPADRAGVAHLISEGVSDSVILQKVREGANEGFKRVHLLEKKDIYNIKKQFKLDFSCAHENDAYSVQMWVQKQARCGEDSSVIFYKAQGGDHDILMKNDFMIVIMTPFQFDMARKFISNKVLIDSTHGTNKYNFSLTTLLTVDEFGVGCPVAYCLSTRIDTPSMMVFLSAVETRIGKIKTEVFMSDDCQSYYNAWTAVMGPSSHRLLCTWHVDRTWIRNIRTKVKDLTIKDKVYKALKTLQLQKTRRKFDDMLNGFTDWCAEDPRTQEFGIYFTNEYAGRPEMWAYCHRVGLGLNTNMYLEALHKTLKYCYFSSKVNRRVDKCIQALLHRTRDLLFERAIRLCKGGLSSGRITKITRSHRESISIKNEMISSLEDGKWQVLSGSGHTPYIVATDSSSCPGCPLSCPACKICVHRYICSCTDSMVKGNICKHIHAIAMIQGKEMDFSQDMLNRDAGLQALRDTIVLQPSSVGNVVDLQAALQDRGSLLKEVLTGISTENAPSILTLLDKVIQQVTQTVSSQKESSAAQELTSPHFPATEPTSSANKKGEKQRVFHSIKKVCAKRGQGFSMPTSSEIVAIEQGLLYSENVSTENDHTYV